LAGISGASSAVAEQPSPQAPTTPVQRAERPKQASQAAGLLSATRPSVPNGIDEYFLPVNQTLSEALKAAPAGVDQSHPQKLIVCHPVLVAQARTLFLNRKYNLDFELAQAVIVSSPDRRGAVRWENFSADPIDPRSLADQPDPQAQFSSLDGPLSDPKILASLQRDFADWAFRGAKVTIRANEELKVFAGPDVSQADFRQLCSDAARKARDAEIETLSQGYDRKLDALQEKIKREQRELDQDETKLSQRKLEELGTHAETLLSLFAKRKSSRRISSSLSKRRMAAEAKASVVESQQTIEDFTQQVTELEKERDKAVAAVENRWGDVAAQIQELTITPLKKDVQVELFGVAWFPYYQVESGGQVVELPAFNVS
jgi:Skp family chaperone for outer membrane proteins